MGMAANFVMWPRPFEHNFVPPSQGGSKWNLASIGPMVSEEKMFENVDNKHTYGRQRPTYIIGLPMSLQLMWAKNSKSGKSRGRSRQANDHQAILNKMNKTSKTTKSGRTLTIILNHNRSTALEWPVIYYLAWSLNRFTWSMPSVLVLLRFINIQVIRSARRIQIGSFALNVNICFRRPHSGLWMTWWFLSVIFCLTPSSYFTGLCQNKWYSLSLTAVIPESKQTVSISFRWFSVCVFFLSFCYMS